MPNQEKNKFLCAKEIMSQYLGGCTKPTFYKFVKLHNLNAYNPVNPGVKSSGSKLLYSVADIEKAMQDSIIKL